MSNRPSDEPAFPVVGGLHENQFSGMGLRDYFAAKALAGLLSGHHHDEDMTRSAAASGLDYYDALAQVAYRTADAMLAERGRT